MNTLESIDDSMLLGAYFPTGISAPWRMLLKASEALQATSEDLELYQHHTGRDRWPGTPARQIWLKFGRRTWKSTMAAAIAVHQSTCVDHSAYLRPGAVGVFMVIADSKDTATVILGYCEGMLRSSPLLSKRIVSVTAERIELNNGCAIEVHSSNYRRVRGRTLIGAVADEICFWRSEEDASSPDREVLRAILPAMLTVPSAKLIVTSSPYRPIGVMFETFEKYFGHDDVGDDVLTATGTSAEMNPTLDVAEIDRLIAADPEAGRSEYNAEWRGDIASLYTSAWLREATDDGVEERAPSGRYDYQAHCDLSGGRRDSFALGIAHKDERGVAVLDFVEEIKPQGANIATVIERFAAVMKSYGTLRVRCDDYAANFAREAFARSGVTAMQPKLYYSGQEKRLDTSMIFIESVVLVSGGKVRLLDHKPLLRQLSALERRARSGGKDSAGHGPGGHDDLSLAAIGALLFAYRGASPDAGSSFAAFHSTALAGLADFEDRRRAIYDGTHPRLTDFFN